MRAILLALLLTGCSTDQALRMCASDRPESMKWEQRLPECSR